MYNGMVTTKGKSGWEEVKGSKGGINGDRRRLGFG